MHEKNNCLVHLKSQKSNTDTHGDLMCLYVFSKFFILDSNEKRNESKPCSVWKSSWEVRETISKLFLKIISPSVPLLMWIFLAHARMFVHEWFYFLYLVDTRKVTTRSKIIQSNTHRRFSSRLSDKYILSLFNMKFGLLSENSSGCDPRKLLL